MEFRQIAVREADAVLDFYWQCIDQFPDMTDKPGWQKGVYPTREFLARASEAGELYALMEHGEYVAAMVLDHHCGESYDTVRWGVPAGQGEFLVVHALGVLPSCHRRGLAFRMIQEAVRIGRESGQKAIRLDVLWNNIGAQKFYLKAGFDYRGTVQLFYEDTGLTDFLLYEYIL